MKNTLIVATALALALTTPLAHAWCTAVPLETDFSEYDLTNDGVVDLDDFSVFRDVFGSAGEIGDFNGDGIVGLQDFSLLRNAFGVHEVTTIVRCRED